jgi:hypothetical protein
MNMKTTTTLKRSLLANWLSVSDTGGPNQLCKSILTTCFLLFTAIGFAQIWTNPITGTNPGNTSPYTTGQTVTPNVTVGGIVRGSGLSSATGNNRYNAQGYSTSSTFNAANNEYFEFTITPAAGYEIDFTSFVYTGQASGTGPASFTFRSSIDNYAAGIGSPIATGATIVLSAAAYQNRTAATTFRLYGWDSSNTTGTYSIDDFTFNGSVCLRPSISVQPTASQALCAGSALNLSVTAANATSYQWKKGGVNIPSATASTYSIASVVTGDAATYTVDVINSCQTITSNNAVVTVSAHPTATGGGSTSTCSNQAVVISGMTAANGTISWSENGTGSITAGGTTAAPTYTPGAGESGTVTLTMTVANLPCTAATANYTINVSAVSTAVAGSAFNACASAINIPITTGASATNGSILWTSNGTGTIANPTSINTATYTPGVGEASTVTFTLTTTATSPCINPTSNKVMTLVQPPTASAGGSATICTTQTAVVSGASSSNGTIAWTENGLGSITSGSATLTPTYTPAAGDAGNAVTLTMTVTNATCGSVQAFYTVNVVGAATAAAGTPITMCANEIATTIGTGATATNNSGVTWTSNGTGSIGNANSLNGATYTPGIGETGNVTLTLTATGNTPCGNAANNKTLTIRAVPVATGAIICQGQPSVALTSATVCPSGSALTAGPNLAGGGANLTGIGNTAWVSGNVNNIVSDNNSYATVVLANSSAISNYLRSNTHGFTIPANATIGGIQVAMSKFATNTLGATRVRDNDLKLVKAGTVVGSNKGNLGVDWPTSEAVSNYGGVADLWGTTWTAADINNANFGIAVSLLNATGVGSSYTASIDYIRITVTYTVPGDLHWYTVSSGGTSLGTGSSFDPVGVAGSGLANTNTPGMTTYYVECSTVAGCRTPVTFTINALPTVSFSGLAASYCGTPASIVLTGNHAPSGTFSGAGITDNGNGTATFNPSVAGSGPHNIIYSYTDGNTCVNTDTQSVTVIAPDTYYADADGDGFGNPSVTEQNCTGPSAGFVANNSDCDDTTIHYLDADGDGFGSTTMVACGGVLNNTDCNDAVLNYSDVDGDGFGSDTFVNCGGVLNSDDCDDNAIQYLDADADGFGSSTQVACGVTNNTDCDDAVLNYTDVDGDGFGSDTFIACGGVLNSDDCDDNVLLYSDADGDGFGSDTLVACGGVSNTLDCDDNAIQYLDNDGDGFGSTTQVACGVLNNTDCDDSDNTKNTTFPFYADADGDSYGAGSLVSVCAVDALTPPTGYSLNNTDCNDADNTIYQSGTLYVDADSDGYSSNVSQVVCYGASIPSGYVAAPTVLDCNDTVSAINPGHAEVLYNGIDDNCDGNLDEGNHLTTTLLPGSCGSTLASIGSLIGITTVAGHPITGYRIRVTNGAEVQILEKNVPHFTMPEFPSYAYATTYTVEIELQRAGVWLGYYGSSCQVSTPAVLAEGGAASVSPSQCGATLEKINTLIATTSLQGITGYRFRITNLTDPFGPNAVQVLDRTQNWFSLQMLTRYNYGTTYRIEVAVKSTGTYGGYGSPCEVNSPASPTLTNYCGATVPSKTTAVAASSLAGITQYRFQITRQLDNASSTIDRSVNWFNFNMVPALIYTQGALYSVRVAVMTSGTWSPFGDACEVTAPNAAKGVPATSTETQAQTEFKVAAYPNPFTADFNIDVTTSSHETVAIKVYDMLGKLVESRTVNASELNMEKVGAQYPSGVYNVIVSQDGTVKTLRVIKR